MDAIEVAKDQKKALLRRDHLGANEFTGWRGFLWPIHSRELKKFIPTFLIFFLLAFIYDMLRNLKTSLVVAASQSGAEVIPFIKVWAMLPGAFAFAAVFMRLSHRFNREQTFYIMTSVFLSFFVVFLTVIYPQRESFELVDAAKALMAYLPSGMMGFAMMVQHWPLTLFYVMTELWGCILLSMLFWGFANEVTSVEEAKRFYPFFLLGANIAAVFAGQVGARFTDHIFDPLIPYGRTAWEQSFSFFIATAVVGGLVIMGLFWWMHRYNVFYPHADAADHKDEKVRLSIRECVSYLAGSHHLLSIALLVLSYNIVFNLSDVMWTHQLKMLYADNVGAMTRYMSHVTSVTGVIAFFISLLVSGNVLRRFGWQMTAMLTPFMIGLTSFGFLFFLLFGAMPELNQLLAYLHTSSSSLVILFGSVQMCFSRACKYTVFDTSKEIAFIPLPTQEQRYGKAAIDGVGSRIGKSTGSLIFQLLFLCCSSIADTTPYVAAMIMLVLFIWVYAVRGLAQRLDS